MLLIIGQKSTNNSVQSGKLFNLNNNFPSMHINGNDLFTRITTELKLEEIWFFGLKRTAAEKKSNPKQHSWQKLTEQVPNDAKFLFVANYLPPESSIITNICLV